MLTVFQASPIAYYLQDATSIDDGPVCGDCADREAGGRTAQEEGQDVDELFIHYYNTPAGFIPSSRYAVEENYPEGVDCVQCGTVIVEPSEDYCIVHGGERSYDAAGDPASSCEYGEELDLAGEGEGCLFPGADPNPPVSRWVPCSTCGAGDGESHDLTKH